MLTALGVAVLIGLAISAIVCYQRPSFAFVLIMVFYTFKQLIQSYIPTFAFNSSWFNYLVAACVGLAVVASLARNRGSFAGYWNRFFAGLVLLYLYAIFGMLYSPSMQWAFDRWRDGAPYWIMQVFLLPLAVPSLAEFRKTLMPFIVIGLIGIALFFTNPYTQFYGARMTLDIGKIIGIPDYRGNPLATAQMGGMIAIVAALMLPMRAAPVANAMRLAGVFFGLGIAVVAGSRAQVILAVMMIVAFWPLARKVRDLKQFLVNVLALSAGCVIVIAALGFFLRQNADQAKRWDITTQLDVVAFRSWEASRLLAAWGEQPAKWVFGLGTNAYSSITGESHSYAHNLLVEMLGELGFIGLGLTLLLLWWTFRLAKELWILYREDPAGRATTTVLLALGTYLLALSMKQGTFLSIPEPWFVLVLIANYAFGERNATASLPLADEDPEGAAAGELLSEPAAATSAR